ncbi:MAG: WG repeat-containing protein [Defluviitaleaceae bacterium]|nr:WG repeat-containing protein [Defluviitaleaceae bacterium]MCL2836413.1 WG repeat-containing protein [Defluviitaleaceae bacterium]
MLRKITVAAVFAVVCLSVHSTAYAGENWEWAVQPIFTLPDASGGFGDALIFSEGLARVGHGGKWGYINENGRIVIPIAFNCAGDFNGNLALASLSGSSYGLIRYNGEHSEKQWEWAVSPSFNMSYVTGDAIKMKGFSEELTLVKQDGKWGYIDKDMEVVIPFVFEVAGCFWGDMALVSTDGEAYGFIRFKDTSAAEPKTEAPHVPSTIVLYNGELINFSKPSVEKNGIVFHPFEDFMQAVGGGYEWNGETKVISGQLNGKMLGVSLPDSSYLINDSIVPMPPETAPFVENERIYVDLAYVIESLGLFVEWDTEAARTISIK